MGRLLKRRNAFKGRQLLIFEPDPEWSNVKSLLRFNEADGSTTVSDESDLSPTWTVSSTRAAVDDQNPKFGNNLQTESDQDLTFANIGYITSDLGLSSFSGNAHTFECFFRIDSFTVHGFNPIFHIGNRSNDRMQAYVNSDGTEIRVMADGFSDVVGSVSLSTGVWYHFAWVLDGIGGYRMFLNGALVTSGTGLTWDEANKTMHWGYFRASFHYSGNMRFDECRVTQAERYTTDFSAPTQEFSAFGPAAATDPNWASVEVLIPADGIVGSTTFTDVKNARTITAVGNAQITGAGRFAQAALFDGAGDYLTVTGLTAIGSGDFTWEAWVNLDTLGTQGFMDGRPVGTNGAYPLVYVDSGVLKYYANTADQITGSSLSASTWHHIALCRESGTTRLFLDGALEGTYADATNYLWGANGMILGGSGFALGTLSLDGRMDDIRLTLGVARYTGAFTPPTAALPTS